MKYLRQFGIILFLSFIGEVLHVLLPFPIPASIYGIVILFLCLEFGIVSLSSVKETSAFLIEIMPIMFIPAAVGLMDSWQIMKTALVPYAVITVITTCAVMVVSGKVVQNGMRRDPAKLGGDLMPSGGKNEVNGMRRDPAKLGGDLMLSGGENEVNGMRRDKHE